MTDSSLAETALHVFEELGASINPLDIETCHRVGPSSRKKLIIKMSRRKDADRMWRAKKPLKSDSHLPKKFLFICFNESPLKMMKNVFYFILKALFVLKIFKFFC